MTAPALANVLTALRAGRSRRNRRPWKWRPAAACPRRCSVVGFDLQLDALGLEILGYFAQHLSVLPELMSVRSVTLPSRGRGWTTWKAPSRHHDKTSTRFMLDSSFHIPGRSILPLRTPQGKAQNAVSNQRSHFFRGSSESQDPHVRNLPILHKYSFRNGANGAFPGAPVYRQDLTIRQYMLGDTPSRFLKVWLK